MAGSDDLHPLLKNINKSIAKLREDVQTLTGEVKKIPRLLQEGFEDLRDAIHENIRAQAELKVMEHMMKVSATKPQIEAEHEQIRNIRTELEERLENISQRYEQKHEELNETAKQRVRELGSHIFAIEEEQFEEGIEEPFTTQVTPVWRDLQAHNQQVNQERETRVVGTTETTIGEINAFLDRKEQLITQIDDHLLEPDAVPVQTDRPIQVQLPYYVVEYEFEGVSERIVVPPSEIRSVKSDDEWCAATLSPVQGTESLITEQADVDAATATQATVDRQAVADELDKYANRDQLGISYTDAVLDAIPRGTKITIEGGDG